ncbi:hypothetical protein V1289_010067 [Bradyrhizobium sp. AZCC 2289]
MSRRKPVGSRINVGIVSEQRVCCAIGGKRMSMPAVKGPNEKFCTDCGSVISARAEICPKCGVRQLCPAAGRPGNSQILSGPRRSGGTLSAVLLDLHSDDHRVHRRHYLSHHERSGLRSQVWLKAAFPANTLTGRSFDIHRVGRNSEGLFRRFCCIKLVKKALSLLRVCECPCTRLRTACRPRPDPVGDRSIQSTSLGPWLPAGYSRFQTDAGSSC